jgi:thiol-disulfide isomerase/thioredoxin
MEVVMATVTLTSENFEQVVTGNDIVLVDFWANRCGPCRMFTPVYEAASETHAEVVFVKVDTEAEQDLAARFGIGTVPNLLANRPAIGNNATRSKASVPCDTRDPRPSTAGRDTAALPGDAKRAIGVPSNVGQIVATRARANDSGGKVR